MMTDAAVMIVTVIMMMVMVMMSATLTRIATQVNARDAEYGIS